MTLHIGIVGCSAEGAALCYRTICAEGAARLGAHRHPEVTLHTPPLADYVDCLDRGDREGVADLMLASAEVLAGAGADFLICPDNTIHQAFDLVETHSPRPWLHIARVVAAMAKASSFNKIGILGTRWLVESDVYPAALEAVGIGWARPSRDDIAEVDRIIMDELVPGHFTDAAAESHGRVIRRLAEAGCDAVVLGCTEIPILMAGREAALPMLDSTRLLARAALDRSISGAAPT